jgi:predicted O-methyltransferase YrrM
MAQMTWEEIPGRMNFEDVYDAAVEECRDGAVFVEVGVWMGRSAAYMASRIKEAGKKIRFYAVDDFEGTPQNEAQAQVWRTIRQQGLTLEQVCLNNIAACELQDYVRVIKDYSWVVAEGFGNETVDFCMIDTGSEYRFVKRDIEAWLPKIKPGGVIAGSNLDEPDVRKAVKEVLGDRWISNNKRFPAWIHHVPKNKK